MLPFRTEEFALSAIELDARKEEVTFGDASRVGLFLCSGSDVGLFRVGDSKMMDGVDITIVFEESTVTEVEKSCFDATERCKSGAFERGKLAGLDSVCKLDTTERCGSDSGMVSVERSPLGALELLATVRCRHVGVILSVSLLISIATDRCGGFCVSCE